MKTKKSGILILFLCIFCVVGCDNDEKKGREVTDYKEYILTVASRKVPGVLTSDGHNYLTDVYAVKKELSDEWIPFGNIEGFDFEEKSAKRATWITAWENLHGRNRNGLK